MAETRKQLKDRLQAAGLWQEYVDLRVQLAADGMTAAQARVEALRRVEAMIAPESQAAVRSNSTSLAAMLSEAWRLW